MPVVGAAIIALGTAAVAAAPAIGAAVGVYSIVEGQRRAKKAESAAEKQAQLEWEMQERQAGEYFDLTKKQMELQSQGSQINTLASLIAGTKQPAEPQIFTLPAAKTYSPVEQINRAIDQWLKAG